MNTPSWVTACLQVTCLFLSSRVSHCGLRSTLAEERADDAGQDAAIDVGEEQDSGPPRQHGVDILDRETSLYSKWGSDRRAATLALGIDSVSEAAVQRLVTLLADADPRVQDSARIAIRRLGEASHPHLATALGIRSLRGPATEILADMGPAGREIIEAFLAEYPPPSSRLEVLSALGAEGLDRILTDVDRYPVLALRALRGLRGGGASWVERGKLTVLASTRVTNVEMREASVLAVAGAPDQGDGVSMGRIGAWVNGGDLALRETGVWYVGHTLSEDHELVAMLAPLLRDPEGNVRMLAAWSIGRALSGQRRAPPGLVREERTRDAPMAVVGRGTEFWGPCLGGGPIPEYLDRYGAWREMVTWADGDFMATQCFLPRPTPLGGRRRLYERLLPALFECLDDGDPKVVMAAAWSIGGSGPLGGSAGKALSLLLSASDRRVRREAAIALADIGVGASQAKEAAVRSLWDGGGPYEVYFLNTLGKDAVLDLIHALGHPDPLSAEFAIMGLGHIEVDAKKYSEELAAVFRKAQYRAAGLLVRAGQDGERVLLEVLTGSYALDTRGVAAFALRRFSRPSTQTIEALRRVSREEKEDRTLRDVCAETLALLI
jgi:HEAT repeat protein